MLPIFVTLTGWFWPKKVEKEERPAPEIKKEHGDAWLRLKEQEG
jgi:hypothetical protein